MRKHELNSILILLRDWLRTGTLAIGLAALICLSCRSETTPRGHLTTVDLRSHLPQGVAEKAPSLSSKKGVTYQDRLPLKEIPGELLIKWHALQDSGNRYLLDANASVIKEAPGYKISISTSAPINRGTSDKIVQAIPIYASWVKETWFRGIEGGHIAAEIQANGNLVMFDENP